MPDNNCDLGRNTWFLPTRHRVLCLSYSGLRQKLSIGVRESTYRCGKSYRAKPKNRKPIIAVK